VDSPKLAILAVAGLCVWPSAAVLSTENRRPPNGGNDVLSVYHKQCGPIAVCVAAALFRKQVPPLEQAVERCVGERDGEASLQDLRGALARLGLYSNGIEFDREDLFLTHPFPAILPLRKQGYSHYVVVAAKDEDRRKVFIIDYPYAIGWRDFQSLSRSWQGKALSFSPEPVPDPFAAGCTLRVPQFLAFIPIAVFGAMVILLRRFLSRKTKGNLFACLVICALAHLFLSPAYSYFVNSLSLARNIGCGRLPATTTTSGCLMAPNCVILSSPYGATKNLSVTFPGGTYAEVLRRPVPRRLRTTLSTQSPGAGPIRRLTIIVPPLLPGKSIGFPHLPEFCGSPQRAPFVCTETGISRRRENSVYIPTKEQCIRRHPIGNGGRRGWLRRRRATGSCPCC